MSSAPHTDENTPVASQSSIARHEGLPASRSSSSLPRVPDVVRVEREEDAPRMPEPTLDASAALRVNIAGTTHEGPPDANSSTAVQVPPQAAAPSGRRSMSAVVINGPAEGDSVPNELGVNRNRRPQGPGSTNGRRSIHNHEGSPGSTRFSRNTQVCDRSRLGLFTPPYLVKLSDLS